MFAHRRRYLKQTVIGLGFISGLWIHLGVDPKSVVRSWLEALLVIADPQHATIISGIFFAFPTLLTCLAIFFAYRRGGWLGLIAVGLAYIAGLWLDARSVVLLMIALLLGFLAARRIR